MTKEERTIRKLKIWIAALAVLLVLAVGGCIAIAITSGAVTTKYVASVNGTVYHKPGCEYIDRIQEENVVIYYSKVEAEAAGKSACWFCIR